MAPSLSNVVLEIKLWHQIRNHLQDPEDYEPTKLTAQNKLLHQVRRVSMSSLHDVFRMTRG